MNKKIILLGIILPIIIIAISYFSTYIINDNTELSKLKKYKLLKEEIIDSTFKINNKEYILTTYPSNKSSYTNNNILIKNKNKYYYLENINNCDKSYYIKDNNIYIHCIGKNDNILKYTINNIDIKKEVLTFNYDNTKDISKIHLTIEKIDNNYIYMHTNVLIKSNDKTKENIKCSLDNRICEYYK